jgi:hypothetical protein
VEKIFIESELSRKHYLHLKIEIRPIIS